MLILFLFSFLHLAGADRHYQIWCVGNCETDITNAKTEPGVVLMGGGVRQHMCLVKIMSNIIVKF